MDTHEFCKCYSICTYETRKTVTYYSVYKKLIIRVLYEYYTYIYYEGIHTYEGILNMYIYVVAR